MDQFSPLRPSFIRVLVLPIGKIERNLFFSVLSRLQSQSSILPLKNLPPQDADDDDYLLSPSRQSSSSLFLDFTAAKALEPQRQHSPFELWRESLLVLGVASTDEDRSSASDTLVKSALQHLRERYGRVVHRHLLLLHNPAGVVAYTNSEHVTHVLATNGSTEFPGAIDMAMGTISINFLHELSTYAQAMQVSPNIQTPGQPSQGLLQSMMSKEDDRPRSRHSTPMEPRSPSGDDSGSRPTSKELPLPPPATTFDQIAAANSLSRSDSHDGRRSKSRPRKDSLDRVPAQALSKEKLKDRGKARVGVVIGSIFLLAGQWTEALKTLVDNTTRLRALSDHIWHAKGLEYTFVCLLLHVWAGLDFQVPPICYQLSDKVRDRLSKALVAELQQRSTSQQTSTHKLSESAPELLKHILFLYHATESGLELPYMTVAEATIRFCKALTGLYNSDGVFTVQDVTNMLCLAQSKNLVQLATPSARGSTSLHSTKLTKTAIADLLTHALPAHEENLRVAEHINILTGVATVYAMLGMQRKKAVMLKSVVQRLVASMDQARRLGAAKMGIHPAASLSVENGTEALVETMQGSKGLLTLADTIVSVLGLRIVDDGRGHSTIRWTPNFGSNLLKSDVLHDLLSLCETAPDLAGISALVAASMAAIVPIQPVDIVASRPIVKTSADEQARHLSIMNRSHWLSKQLGSSEVLANYWDANLVRMVRFQPLRRERQLTRHRPTHLTSAADDSVISNPLIYDPYAPKKKAVDVSQVLVCGELAVCQITLQNAIDTAIDLESLELIVVGPGLAPKISNIRLAPACLQEVSFNVTPQTVGTLQIKGCRIKLLGCREQIFAITSLATSPTEVETLKLSGQDALKAPDDSSPVQTAGTEAKVIVQVIEPQPLLQLEGIVEPSSTLMLLFGQTVQISLTLRNQSAVPAIIKGFKVSDGLLLGSAEQSELIIQPSAKMSFTFELRAQSIVNHADINVRYSATSNSQFERALNTQLDITCQPGLQVTRFGATAGPDDMITLAIDIFNSWHQPLSALCETKNDQHWQSDGLAQLIAPGQIRRIYTDVRMWLKDTKAGPDAYQCAAELRQHVRVKWFGDGRVGEVPLQASMLSADVVELIRGPAFSISLKTEEVGLDYHMATARAGSFFIVHATVANHSGSDSGPLSIQLYCSTPGIGSADPRHGVAVVGSAQRLIPSIRTADRMDLQFALCALNVGQLEVAASITPALASAAHSVRGQTGHKLRLKIVA